MFAHYFAGTPRRSHEIRRVLLITREPSITPTADNPIEEILVSGKVEARKIAAERSAKPWNF